MKKILILLPLIISMASCQNSNKDITGAYALPIELEDCSISYLTSSTEYNITVVRCPNSDTTTHSVHSCGKGCIRKQNTTVIDGVKYVQADQQYESTNEIN